MHFDSSFRYVGSVDPQQLKDAIDELGESAWDEFDVRQEAFEAHRHTQTIPLLFDLDSRHSNSTPWPRLERFKAPLEQALRAIMAANPNVSAEWEGYFVRIILTRLSPGASINEHIDAGFSLKRSHRCHLAVKTNNLVDFQVGDEVKQLAAGEIWEINNRETHAVRNKSSEPRVHIIIDYVVPGEKIMDPEDGLIFA